MTVLLLACGGAAFMSALNVSSAWVRSVERDHATRRHDLIVQFAEAQAIARLQAVLAALPEVERVEFWTGAAPWLIGPSGVPGAAVSLVGVPDDSRLMEPRLAAGRWLTANGPDAAVVNTAVLARDPNAVVGGTVGVRLNGRTWTFPVVGVAKELAPMAAIYVPRRVVLAANGQDPSLARSARVVARRHDDAGQRAAAAAIEAAMEREGIEVAALHRTLDMKQGILDHLVIIMAILTMAATVVVFVGALALASTVALAVVQRTREFGVLGAIGATPGTIAWHVWIEAVTIGLLSWVLAFAIAAPVTAVLEAVCGRIFFRAPLDFHMAPSAAFLWLGVVLVIATVASLMPARRAARMPVRQALAHV
jgi:putative ABC transport system permease protein